MIQVTCAIVERSGKVLITRRSARMSQPLLWEFPGGKIEAGESEEGCLIREIKEELNLDIICRERLTSCTYSYPDKTIELIPFVCSLAGGAIRLLEHDSFKWVVPDELISYNWCPADIPVVEEYLNYKLAKG